MEIFYVPEIIKEIEGNRKEIEISIDHLRSIADRVVKMRTQIVQPV